MAEPSGLMRGKRGLIMGVANDHSIAWGIARRLADQGAELAFTYQPPTLDKRVRPLAKSVGMDSLDKLRSVIGDTIGREFAAASRRKVKRQLLDALDEGPGTIR